MQKLNSTLNLKVTSEEKKRLFELSEQLGFSLNHLCRAMLNGMGDYIQFYGLENCYFKLGKVILLEKNPKEQMKR